MYDTTVTIQRPAGTTLTGLDGRLAVHLIAQIDQSSDKEMVELRAIYDFQGNNLYKVYLPWYPNALVKQDDVLLDERFINPDIEGATTYYQYNVVGRPKNFYLDHQTCYCTVEVGS